MIKTSNLSTLFLLLLSLAPFGIAHSQPAAPQYHLDQEQRNIAISVALPHDGKLKLAFARTTDWKAVDLKKIISFANAQYHHLSDSFKNPMAQKIISIKLSDSDNLATLQWRERMPDASRQLVFKDGQYFPLKTDLDTLTILKDGSRYKKPVYLQNDSEQYISQVEYTFVLRDLSDLSSINNNDSLITKITTNLDSVMNSKRLAKRDYWQINWAANKIQATPKNTFMKNIGFSADFGAELLNGHPAAVMDGGLVFLEQRNVSNSAFIGLSASSFLSSGTDPAHFSYYAAFNVEIGNGNTLGGRLTQRNSVGFGYFIGHTKYSNRLASQDSTNAQISLPNYFRFYFNLAVASNFSVGLDLYTNFKFKSAFKSPSAASSRNSSMIGIYLKYNIL